MAKKKPEEAAPGSPAWMATFSDLMNLLLCFFVLLFSMSSIDAQKFELVAASFANTFSIFTAGGQAVGDGILISNGVSQLSQLDDYLNSTGKAAESDKQITDTLEEFDNQRMAESEEMAEFIGISVEKYESLTQEERYDWAYDKFRHCPALLDEFMGLPDEVDIPLELVDDEDISNWLSDEYGFCHEGFKLKVYND